MTAQHSKPKRWRPRFSVRTVLLVVLFTSLSVAFCVRLHRDWYVPRTPLRWTNYSPSHIAHLRQFRKRVVILASSDATMVGSFGHMLAVIDTPLLRQAVFDRQAAIVRARTWEDRAELENLVGEIVHGPTVIVMSADGSQVQVLKGLVTDQRVVDALYERDE